MYAAGKIYQISSTHTQKVYVGSTTVKYLSNRMANHRAAYKANIKLKNRHELAARELLQYPDAKIELVELFPCTCIEELKKREHYWAGKLNSVSMPPKAKLTFVEDGQITGGGRPG